MSKRTIDRILSQEILDSRGDPTVRTTVILDDGQTASAAVPAGASTGSHEARELRDGGTRYGGKGVLEAVRNAMTVINDGLHGMAVDDQPGIDQKLIAIDGSPDRSKLGANAILSVSLASARAASVALRTPLYQYLQQRYQLPEPRTFPRPMCNIINGGKHADNNVSFQEYHVLASGKSFAEHIERTWLVIKRLRSLLEGRRERTLIGDEGGFAPRLASNVEGIELLQEAVSETGLRLDEDVSFGLDVAASEFYDARAGTYRLQPDARTMTPAELINWYQELRDRFPIRTIEDPLAEDDWSNWTELTRRIGAHTVIIGDDLFVTQRDRLSQGIKARAANAILIKPNQVGTLTETMETIAVARDDGYTFIVSHRSGETCDDFIADLAVAVGSPYLKAGALARGERLAKYNRLLTIASEVGA